MQEIAVRPLIGQAGQALQVSDSSQTERGLLSRGKAHKKLGILWDTGRTSHASCPSPGTGQALCPIESASHKTPANAGKLKERSSLVGVRAEQSSRAINDMRG